MNNIPFSKAKLNGAERKQVIQAVQTQMQQAALAAITPLITSFLEEEALVKLGRAKYASRQVGTEERTIDWTCRYCGCQDANQFTRDGHYQPNLETGWGHINGLKVPMLEGWKCRHAVVVQWAVLEKFKRFWLDLDQKVLFGSGLCQSLRRLSAEWSSLIGGSVGLRTLSERINAVESLIEVERKGSLASVPSVMQLDGIWLSLQTQADQPETIKIDKRGRKRHKRTGKRVVVLVALGLWSDDGHRREIPDWQVAESENQADWEKLLQRLYDRGVNAETGLRVVVRDGGTGLGEALRYVYGNTVADQRCIFHKLKNVGDACSSELKAEQNKDLLGQAKGIYPAESAERARELLANWVVKWLAAEPKATASLQRDFEQTLTYYSLESSVAQLARTTSLLERTNRELRRKFRQVGVYGSERGVAAGVYLQVKRLNGWWAKVGWWQTSQSLFFQLLAN